MFSSKPSRRRMAKPHNPESDRGSAVEPPADLGSLERLRTYALYVGVDKSGHPAATLQETCCGTVTPTMRSDRYCYVRCSPSLRRQGVVRALKTPQFVISALSVNRALYLCIQPVLIVQLSGRGPTRSYSRPMPTMHPPPSSLSLAPPLWLESGWNVRFGCPKNIEL